MAMVCVAVDELHAQEGHQRENGDEGEEWQRSGDIAVHIGRGEGGEAPRKTTTKKATEISNPKTISRQTIPLASRHNWPVVGRSPSAMRYAPIFDRAVGAKKHVDREQRAGTRRAWRSRPPRHLLPLVARVPPTASRWKSARRRDRDHGAGEERHPDEGL